VLAGKLVGLAGGAKTKLAEGLRLFKPDTVWRWHRDLARRQWTFTQRRQPGRPAPDPELRKLLRRAQENPRWG
jgi:hypothetical protein